VPLRVDVLRHGEAEPAGEGGDAARRLSPAGRGVCAALGASLAVEGGRPDRIFTSPLVRARQTAEIVRAALQLAPAIERLDELLPDAEPSDVLAALRAHGVSKGHVLLVTHQPLAGRLTALLAGDAHAFRPGGLVRIECEPELAPGQGRVIRAIEPGRAG
jgi:phosphohistidine phosphatase